MRRLITSGDVRATRAPGGATNAPVYVSVEDVERVRQRSAPTATELAQAHLDDLRDTLAALDKRDLELVSGAEIFEQARAEHTRGEAENHVRRATGDELAPLPELPEDPNPEREAIAAAKARIEGPRPRVYAPRVESRIGRDGWRECTPADREAVERERAHRHELRGLPVDKIMTRLGPPDVQKGALYAAEHALRVAQHRELRGRIDAANAALAPKLADICAALRDLRGLFAQAGEIARGATPDRALDFLPSPEPPAGVRFLQENVVELVLIERAQP